MKAGVSPAVLYESPHRVTDLLERIATNIPGARVTVCCDLSKKFERIDRGDIAQVLAAVKQNPNAEKGEYCVVVEFDPPPEKSKEEGTQELSTELRLMQKLLSGEDIDDACEALKSEGARRNDIYRAKLALMNAARSLTGER